MFTIVLLQLIIKLIKAYTNNLYKCILYICIKNNLDQNTKHKKNL